MKITILLLFSLLVQLSFSQQTTQNDTMFRVDKGTVIPRWKINLKPFCGSSTIYTYYGANVESEVRINDYFHVSAVIGQQFYDDVFNKDEAQKTTNFELFGTYNLIRHTKSKSQFYLKHFRDSTRQFYFRPDMKYNKFSLLQLQFGLKKYSLTKFTRSNGYFKSSYDPSIPIDNQFDEESSFDYDGFLNELKRIRQVDHYALKLGINYSQDKNFSSVLGKKKVSRNNKKEIYVSVFYDMFSKMRYDPGTTTGNLFQSVFSQKTSYKHLGYNIGLRYTKRFRNNYSAINVNLETGFLPDIILTESFYSELTKHGFYIVADQNNPDQAYFLYGHDFDYQFYKTRQYFYMQFSIGYTFGQKF